MKTSTVMVHTVVHLPTVLSDMERDVLRKVLLEGIRGIDAAHDKRWRRFIGGLINSEPGVITDFVNPRARSLPFHKRHMKIEKTVFENQDIFPPTKAGQRKFRDWLKVGASLARLELHGDEPKWLPGSLSYDEMSDDEMREFHEAAMDYLRSPRALRKLWPAVKSAQRLQMLETLIRNPDEQEQHA